MRQYRVSFYNKDVPVSQWAYFTLEVEERSDLSNAINKILRILSKISLGWQLSQINEQDEAKP